MTVEWFDKVHSGSIYRTLTGSSTRPLEWQLASLLESKLSSEPAFLENENSADLDTPVSLPIDSRDYVYSPLKRC